MKKNIIYLITIACFACSQFSLPAQSYIKYWDKTYGGNNRDWNCRITKNNTGQLFIIGDSQTNINADKIAPPCDSVINNSDIWLLKIDTSGTILNQKDLGAEGDERLPVLINMNNTNKEMIFASYSLSDTACDKTENNRDTIPLLSADYWLCFTDSNGTKIWDKTLGGDNYDDYPQIDYLTTGEFIVSGESNSPVSGDKTVPGYSAANDLWTVKLGNSGNIIWDKVYGGNGNEYLASIIPLSNGSFILAGSTASDISGDVSETNRGVIDYWMIKVDAGGNKIWDHRYGGSALDRCLHASVTTDNGFILCGYTLSPISGEVTQAPKGFQDYWIIKTDSLGVKQWDKRFGGNNGAFATWVEPALAGGYWLSGYTDSGILNDVSEASYGGSDYWILRLDNIGNKLWDKRFGGDQNDYSTNFVILPDTSILLFGYSDSGYSATKTAPNKGWWDYWLVKFKYTIPVGIEEVNNTQSLFSLFPNPGNGKYILNYLPGYKLNADVVVYDIIGKEIFSSDNVNLSHYLIDISSCSNGIYFLKINFKGRTFFSDKLIKLF